MFYFSPDKNNGSVILCAYGIIKNWSGWCFRIFNPFTSAKGFISKESRQQSECCNLFL